MQAVFFITDCNPGASNSIGYHACMKLRQAIDDNLCQFPRYPGLKNFNQGLGVGRPIPVKRGRRDNERKIALVFHWMGEEGRTLLRVLHCVCFLELCRSNGQRH